MLLLHIEMKRTNDKSVYHIRSYAWECIWVHVYVNMYGFYESHVVDIFIIRKVVSCWKIF